MNAAFDQATKPFYAGVWIDRSRALIVVYDHNGTQITEVNSTIPGGRKATGGRGTFGAGRGTVRNEKRLFAQREREEKEFFQNVVENLGLPEELLILGPGQAKLGLRRELHNHQGLRSRIVGLETKDRMTENQLMAHVKTYFMHERYRQF